MEPFRPRVDRVVARIRLTSASSNAQSQNEPPAVAPARTGTQGPTVQLDQNSKKLILEGLLVRYSGEGESRTLFDWASRSASSLVALIEERDEKLSFPELVPAPCNP